MNKHINTIIVGGGQAGLAMSYWLKQQEREHVILERSDKPAHTWRNERWDSFTLVTPNWQIQMPGAEYQDDEPDGFLPRDAVVAYQPSQTADCTGPGETTGCAGPGRGRRRRYRVHCDAGVHRRPEPFDPRVERRFPVADDLVGALHLGD